MCNCVPFSFLCLFILFFHPQKKKGFFVPISCSFGKLKWSNITVFENILQSTTVFEICWDLPPIRNSSFPCTRVPWKNFENFLWNLSSIKKQHGKLKGYFFKEIEFQRTRVSKMWQIAKYFINSGRCIHIFPNSSIQPFWPCLASFAKYMVLFIYIQTCVKIVKILILCT